MLPLVGPSAARAEERPQVAGEQVRDLHGREVAAAVVLGPVLDRASRVEQAADRGVGGEHGHAPRWPGVLARMPAGTVFSRLRWLSGSITRTDRRSAAPSRVLVSWSS